MEEDVSAEPVKHQHLKVGVHIIRHTMSLCALSLHQAF